MKVKTGGGGIDADGNWFDLPSEEIEVPDDYFQQFAKAMAAIPRQTSIPVPAWVFEDMQRILAEIEDEQRNG